VHAINAYIRKETKLTPWNTVLPEKLTDPSLLKKFPAFYGTRRFVTAGTGARHLPYLESYQSSPRLILLLEDPF
jgi:hypothetical protein